MYVKHCDKFVLINKLCYTYYANIIMICILILILCMVLENARVSRII